MQVMSALEVKLTKISLCRVRSHPFCHSPRIPASSEKLVLHRTLRQIRSIGFHKESWSLLRTQSIAGAPERTIVINMLHTFQLFPKTFWLLGKILKAAAKQPQSSSKAAAKQQQSSSKAAAKQQQSSSKAAAKQQQSSSKAAAKQQQSCSKAAAKQQSSSKAAKQQQQQSSSSSKAAAATVAQKHCITCNPTPSVQRADLVQVS